MTDGFRLSIQDLALARGDRVLFKDLNLTAEPGAVIEITGANGAGKTSLLRAIAGFLRPLTGRIEAPDRAETIHFLGHRDGTKPSLSVISHAQFWAALYGGEEARCEIALQRLGLFPLADLPARALSQGQSRRLALTRLITAPRKIWLLDEPTAALDAAGKALVRDLIAEHAAAGGITLAAVHEPLGAPGARGVLL